MTIHPTSPTIIIQLCRWHTYTIQHTMCITTIQTRSTRSTHLQSVWRTITVCLSFVIYFRRHRFLFLCFFFSFAFNVTNYVVMFRYAENSIYLPHTHTRIVARSSLFGRDYLFDGEVLWRTALKARICIWGSVSPRCVQNADQCLKFGMGKYIRPTSWPST